MMTQAGTALSSYKRRCLARIESVLVKGVPRVKHAEIKKEGNVEDDVSAREEELAEAFISLVRIGVLVGI